jgi:outer membrane lipoprotein-sorting protein
MATPDTLEQLAAARPEITGQTTVVMDAEMRTLLRASIVESATSSLGTARSRRNSRRRTVFAVASLAVCIGLVAIVLTAVPRHPQNAAATILAKTVSALAEPDVGVVVAHQVQYGPKGIAPTASTFWQDPRDRYHFRMAIAEPPVSEVGGYVENGKAETISVNFDNRSALIMPADPLSSSVAYAPTQTQLENAQQAGDLSVVGNQSVDGVGTVHLFGTTTKARTDLWIDPVDYQLVRIEVRFSNGYRVVADIHWLPPTPANLALLNVTVPSGFTVTQLPSRTAP